MKKLLISVLLLAGITAAQATTYDADKTIHVFTNDANLWERGIVSTTLRFMRKIYNFDFKVSNDYLDRPDFIEVIQYAQIADYYPDQVNVLYLNEIYGNYVEGLYNRYQNLLTINFTDEISTNAAARIWYKNVCIGSDGKYQYDSNNRSIRPSSPDCYKPTRHGYVLVYSNGIDFTKPLQAFKTIVTLAHEILHFFGVFEIQQANDRVCTFAGFEVNATAACSDGLFRSTLASNSDFKWRRKTILPNPLSKQEILMTQRIIGIDIEEGQSVVRFEGLPPRINISAIPLSPAKDRKLPRKYRRMKRYKLIRDKQWSHMVNNNGHAKLILEPGQKYVFRIRKHFRHINDYPFETDMFICSGETICDDKSNAAVYRFYGDTTLNI